MILDAKNLKLGRLAQFAAKKALLGEEVTIVNCADAVVSGKKERVFADYKRKRDMGTFKGPFIHRKPDMLVKRTIRGMLPYKSYRGKNAMSRIRCYSNVPEKLKQEKAETIKSFDAANMKNLYYVTVSQICAHLGGKQ